MALITRAMARRFKPEKDDLIAYWSDDFYPISGFPSAIFEARKQYEAKRFLQVRDGVLNGERAATIPFITWDWLQQYMGGFFWPPCYKYVVDVEPYRKAHLTGDYLYVSDCFIQHKNHFAGTRPRDHVDEHNLIRDNEDWSLISKRSSLGFPVESSWDAEAIDAALPVEIFDESFYFVEMQ
jgi:hypothetical protein